MSPGSRLASPLLQAAAAAVLVVGLLAPASPAADAPAATASLGLGGLWSALASPACRALGLACGAPDGSDAPAPRALGPRGDGCGPLAGCAAGAAPRADDGFVAELAGPAGPGSATAAAGNGLAIAVRAVERVGESFEPYRGPLELRVALGCPAAVPVAGGLAQQACKARPTYVAHGRTSDGTHTFEVPASVLSRAFGDDGLAGASVAVGDGRDGARQRFSPFSLLTNALLAAGQPGTADALEATQAATPLLLTDTLPLEPAGEGPAGLPAPGVGVPGAVGGDGFVARWGFTWSDPVAAALTHLLGDQPFVLEYRADGSFYINGTLAAPDGTPATGSATVALAPDCGVLGDLCAALGLQGAPVSKAAAFCPVGSTGCRPGEFSAHFTVRELEPLLEYAGPDGFLRSGLLPIGLTVRHSSWPDGVDSRFNWASQALYATRLDQAAAFGDLLEDATSTPVFLQTPRKADLLAPTAVLPEATALSPTVVRLTWPAAQDDRGVHHYVVRRLQPDAVTLSGDVRGLAFKDVQATPATQHVYQVHAVDAAGNEGAPGTTLVVTPRLPAPAGDGESTDTVPRPRSPSVRSDGGDDSPAPAPTAAPRPTSSPLDRRPVPSPPTGSAPAGPADTADLVRAYNRAVAVTVERRDDANVVRWTLPAEPPLPVEGVQVWRANSPYTLIGTFDKDTTTFQVATLEDDSREARPTSRYLVTVYFGLSEALGFREASEAPPESVPGAAPQAAVGQAVGGPPWLAPLVVSAVAVALLAIVALARRRPAQTV